jgi:glycosyltransferase involved in cell wall biosynthesis
LIRYFTTAGDQHGWAIDEDLRLIRRALAGKARASGLGSCDVVHAAFWLPLALHHADVVRRRFVVAQADNPPFFYLTQPSFAWGQKLVDLWVARSTEARDQFRDLQLPCVLVPYAIDGSLFFPIADKEAVRAKYGLPKNTYIIGNFHRDSEGSDLAKPKLQKSPEMMLDILRRLRAKGGNFHVLLAGPRRHWLRRELERCSIPFTFVGRDIPRDDFGTNILARPQLNELYNACDLYLIPSRWEGGPQSAMEAAAARTKLLSTPLGVARDILPAPCLFDAASEAAEKIHRDMQNGFLGASLDAQHDKVRRDHTDEAMSRHLRALYDDIPKMESFRAKASCHKRAFADSLRDFSFRVAKRFSRLRLPQAVQLFHHQGCAPALDAAVGNLRTVFDQLGVEIRADRSAPVVSTDADPAAASFRLLPPGGEVRDASDETVHIASSVQDAVNFRRLHPRSPVVVCPLVFTGGTNSGHTPCIIDENDNFASQRIWQAMLEGKVPVYPAGTAYYYQVFHGGVSHGRRRTRDEAVRIAIEERESFLAMSRPPSLEAALSFWRGLLAA